MVIYKKRKERRQEKIKSWNILPDVPTVIEFKVSTDHLFVDLHVWVSDIIPCHIVAPQHKQQSTVELSQSYLSGTTKPTGSKLDTDHLFVILHMRMLLWLCFCRISFTSKLTVATVQNGYLLVSWLTEWEEKPVPSPSLQLQTTSSPALTSQKYSHSGTHLSTCPAYTGSSKSKFRTLLLSYGNILSMTDYRASTRYTETSNYQQCFFRQLSSAVSQGISQ